MNLDLNELLNAIKPVVLSWMPSGMSASGVGGSAPSPHNLYSVHHSGLLDDSQATQFLKLDGTRALTGNLSVSSGITIDGVDISTLSDAVHSPRQIIAGAGLTGGGDLGADRTLDVVAADTSLTINANDMQVRLAATSGLQISSGLMLADTVAGAGLVIASKVLAVGAGAGITVNADDVALTTPGALSQSSGNSSSGSHTHAITSSNNPGAAAAILASTSAGLLTLAALTVSGTITPGTGIAGSLIPTVTDTYDIGSATKLWRKGYLSEMDALLFSKNTVSVIGGWLMIAKNSGAIPVGQDVAAANTTIDFGQAMTLNQFVLFRAAGAVEYVQVGSLSSGTRYNVTRNLDGSGANDWPAGSVYVVLGVNGDGRIELNANSTPRISISKQGATYNAVTETVRIGDVNGLGGASVETYGFYAGDGTNYIRYDPLTSPNFAIVAGGGSITIDTAAINLSGGAAQRLRFVDSGTAFAGLFGTYGAGIGAAGMAAQGKAAGEQGWVGLTALDEATATQQAYLYVKANGTTAKSWLEMYGAVGTFSGLTIGDTAVPGAMLDVRGDVMLTGSIKQSTPLGTRVYNSGAQTIGNSSSTAVTFDSERWDTDGCHSTSSNTSRLTCQTAGKYHIIANIEFVASTVGDRVIFLRLNGSTIIAAHSVVAPTLNCRMHISTIYDLAAADYVEVLVRQTTAGNLDTVATGNSSPEFMMVRCT